MRGSTKKSKKLDKKPEELIQSARTNRVIDEANLRKVASLVMDRALNHSLPDQKLILETYGKRKGRPIKIESGLIKSPEDCSNLGTAVISLMCDGDVTPEEASVVLDVLAQKIKLLEVVDFAKRLGCLESKMGMNEDSYKTQGESFPVNPLVQEKLIEMRLQEARIDHEKEDYIASLKQN